MEEVLAARRRPRCAFSAPRSAPRALSSKSQAQVMKIMELVLKLPFCMFTNLSNPTSNGVVDLSKSLPADNNPASILLALNTGVPVNFKSYFIPASKILSPIFL